jgi:hypothetical protein
MSVFGAPIVTGRSNSQLNMDCLGEVSVSQPKGLCAVTFTYKDSSVADPKIQIHFMDEEGLNETENQIGGVSRNDWNSMVVLTDETNFAITFMSELPEK